MILSVMAIIKMFMIVSKEDFPLYELAIEGLTKRKDYVQLHEFILHSSLDVIEHIQWTSPNMYLRTIDKFNELSVTCLLTPSSKPFYNQHLIRCQVPSSARRPK